MLGSWAVRSVLPWASTVTTLLMKLRVSRSCSAPNTKLNGPDRLLLKRASLVQMELFSGCSVTAGRSGTPKKIRMGVESNRKYTKRSKYADDTSKAPKSDR